MKINIRPKDCRFIVDQEKRKVICIIDNTENKLFDFIDYGFGVWYNPKCPLEFGHTIMEKLRMPRRFTGVATCAPDDEWNEEIGRAIAYGKAKYKFNVSLFKRGNYLVNYMDEYIAKLARQFDEYGERVSRNEAKRDEWLDKAVGIKEE